MTPVFRTASIHIITHTILVCLSTLACSSSDEPSSSTGGQGGSFSSGGTNSSGEANTAGSNPGDTNHTGSSSSTGGTAGNGGATYSDFLPCPTDGTPCKIMPFGDSITHGYNSDTPGGYRVELFRLAHAAGKNITFVGSQETWYNETVDGVTFPPNHEGHSGYTIDPVGGRQGISPLVSTVMPEYTPHIVLLMIGTNDAIDDYDMLNAPNRLGALIDSIYTQLPDVLLVVAQLIPSRGDATQGDDTTLTSRIETYNTSLPAVIQTRANSGKHILLVDMFTPFASNKTNLLEDQWHPNLAGYVTLGTQWYNVISPYLP